MPKPRKMINPEQVSEQVPEPVLEPVVVVKKPRKPRTPKVKVDGPLEDIPIPVLKRERKVNPWLEHCKSVKLENDGMKYSEVLKLAKESYKK